MKAFGINVVGVNTTKIPLLDGVGLVPVGVFCRAQAGNRNERWSCPCEGLSCNLTRTQCGLALPMEDKDPVLVGGSSSPMRGKDCNRSSR